MPQRRFPRVSNLEFQFTLAWPLYIATVYLNSVELTELIVQCRGRQSVTKAAVDGEGGARGASVSHAGCGSGGRGPVFKFEVCTCISM